MASGGFATNFVRQDLGRVSSWGDLAARVGVGSSPTVTGSTFYVDSGVGSNNNDGLTPVGAKATIAGAISAATASNGDRILVAEGHTESIPDATTLAINKAGLTIIGCGVGADRPTLTFATATTANIPISAASCVFTNFLLVCNLDSVVAAVTVSAADNWIDNVEFRDATDKEFVTPFLTTASADRLRLTNCYHNGFTTGDACTEAFSLIGVDTGVIENCRFLGNYSTAAVNMLTTASTKMVMRGLTFVETGDKTLSKLVKDTQGSSTWCLSESVDISTGLRVEGSSGGAVMAAGSGFRFSSATSTSPLTSGTIFTFTGGIEILRIQGLVTTVIQSQATNTKLSVTPDSQTAVDICANKDINAFAAGSLLQIVGTAASAMVGTTAVAVRAPSTTTGSVDATCVTTGTITTTFGAASTGAIRWDMVWRPLTRNASVV